MEIFIIILFASWNNGGCGNCRLSYFLGEHSPVIVLLAEILQSVFRYSVGNTDVYTVWRKNTVNLIKHCLAVWTWIVTAENGIETSLVDDCIEDTFLTLQTAGIHLLESQLRDLFFVILLHLLDDCKRNVNVRDVLVTVLEHVFRHFRVAATEHEDLEGRLNILGNHVLDTRVSLVPIKWLLVFLIPILPILGLSVLCHIVL